MVELHGADELVVDLKETKMQLNKRKKKNTKMLCAYGMKPNLQVRIINGGLRCGFNFQAQSAK
jgi:hypothetical protein